MATQLQSPESPHTSLMALPTEMKVAIFTSLPDISSVKALTLTSRSYFHTFLGAQSHILDTVLRNQIYPELWSLAVTVLKSSRLEPWSKEGVLMVLAHLRTDQAPCPWTISKALSISEFHRHVHFFAADFASSALATTPQAQATPKELCRIQRTLYRFELYCNSVGRSNACEFEYFSEEEQRGYFFARFPPWENEQLACVHDYLFEQLSLPFNDVAEHDVQWGELRIPYANDWFGIDNTWKEHYLSLGLAYLHQAVTAATYDERYKLITSNMGNDEFFLFEGLKRQGDDDAFELSDFGTEEEDKYLKKHLAVDDDSGPFEAWRWAYADSSRECLYFGDEQRKLRRSAYVMWDLARLSQQGILRTEWVPDPGPVVDPEEYNRRAKEMKESFDERLKVYGRGGLGWWSPGDESKVRWRQQVAEKPKTAPDRSWDKKELWAKDMEQWRNNLKG